jgi:hypothetical protein
MVGTLQSCFMRVSFVWQTTQLLSFFAEIVTARNPARVRRRIETKAIFIFIGRPAPSGQIFIMITKAAESFKPYLKGLPQTASASRKAEASSALGFRKS